MPLPQIQSCYSACTNLWFSDHSCSQSYPRRWPKGSQLWERGGFLTGCHEFKTHEKWWKKKTVCIELCWVRYYFKPSLGHRPMKSDSLDLIWELKDRRSEWNCLTLEWQKSIVIKWFKRCRHSKLFFEVFVLHSATRELLCQSAWENHGNSWLTSTKIQVPTDWKKPFQGAC